jgi:hypothetical protein
MGWRGQEVFHVDGEGRERGVVLSEMQGREATEDDMGDNAAYQLLYPGTGRPSPPSLSPSLPPIPPLPACLPACPPFPPA